MKVGQTVICIWGFNKGLELQITKIKGNDVTAKDRNGKIYGYKKHHLKEIGK